MSWNIGQATANYKTQRTYQVGFDSLFSSLLANLDITSVASQLQQDGCITSEECRQIADWTRRVPKQDALHSFLQILSKSPLRSLKAALRQCPSSPGHGDLLRQIEAMGLSEVYGGETEEKPKEREAVSQLSIHDPTVSISWKQLSSMLVGMQNAHARVLGNKIYVGGGATGMIDLSCKVYVYDYVYDKWDVLSLSPVYNFALEVYDNSILLIGGREADSGVVTGEVWSWNQTDQIWKESPLQPMPTPRHSASSAAYGQYIVVAGGFAVTAPVSTVEVYSGTSEQWIPAQSLPQPQSHMKQVVANGTWILMGGSGSKGGTQMVFSTSLEALISNAEGRLLPSGFLTRNVLWRVLPQLPHSHSSAAYLGDSIVAIGREGGVSRSPVYVYSPDTLTWILVSELPLRIENSTVARIPNGDIVILGGVTKEKSEPSKQVYVASLQSIRTKIEQTTTPTATRDENHEPPINEPEDVPSRDAAVMFVEPADTVQPVRMYSRVKWNKSSRVRSQSSTDGDYS